MCSKVLLSPIDSRVLVSAPVMTTVAALIALSLLTYEGIVSRKNMEPLNILLFSEDEDETYEPEKVASLPFELEEALEALVNSSQKGSMSVDKLNQVPVFVGSDGAAQVLGEAFVGKLLLQRRRTQEALALLGALSEEERVAAGVTFDWARALSLDGQKVEAIEAYKVHVTNFPGHQLGALNYGIVLGKAGRHREALGALQHAADISSGKLKAKALLLRGNNWFALEQFEEASLDYQRSLEYRPDSALTWRKLAVAKSYLPGLEEKDFVGDFERAIALAPDSAITYLQWANALFARGQFDDALIPYQKAQKSGPNRFDIILRRSLNLIASERPSAATELLAPLRSHASSKRRIWEADVLQAILEGREEKIRRLLENGSISKDKDVDDYLRGLANIEIGNVDVLEGDLRFLKAHPDYGVSSAFEEAKHFFRNEDYETAYAKLESLSLRAPNSPLIFLYLGRSEIALDQTHNAEVHLLRARELDSNSRKIAMEYATLLRRIGKMTKAIGTLEDYLAVKPKDISTLRLLGEFQASGGRIKDAIKTYSQVFALDDTDVASGSRLAELLSDAQDVQKSLTTINLVIDSQPNNIDARVLKAKIYLKAGRVDRAATALEQAILLAPDREDLKGLLVELRKQENADKR